MLSRRSASPSQRQGTAWRGTARQRTAWLGLPVLLVTAVLVGAWLGERQQATEPARGHQQQLEQDIRRLRSRLAAGQADGQQQQRLLELLVALERRGEAVALLEPMADREPDRWPLRLLLATLRRAQNDRQGAERELRQILVRQPLQVESLQLLSQLRLEQGDGAAAEQLLQRSYRLAFRPTVQPEALGIGLLLADLQRRRGGLRAAEQTAQQVASAFPHDQRPWLLLALLQQERGDERAAQRSLQLAGQRSGSSGGLDAPALQKLQGSLGLKGGPPGPGGPPLRPAR